jgi:hypothetical protein
MNRSFAPRARRRSFAPAAHTLVALAALAACGTAQAGNFQTEGGLDVRWSLGTSLGSGWRTRDADPNLIALGNGGRASIQNDNGNLNFAKGDAFSTAGSVLGEVGISKNKLGVFVRAKAWHDFTLANEGMPHGHYANGYRPGAKLDDSDFDDLSKFQGATVLDAYVHGEFQLTPRNALSLRLGQQVVNWGESIFVPGVNQYATFDVTAAHRPGAQVKEILLPVPQAFASLSISEDISIEAFYQLRHRKTVLDGCGTYWSPANLVNCASGGTLVGGGPFPDRQMFDGIAALGGLNMRMTLAPEREARDSGQFGLAGRFRVSALDTDFGIYHAQYNTRVPFLSAVLNPSTVPGSIWSMTIPGQSRAMQVQLDYSADKIKVTGLSATTVLGGWSVFGEISHARNVPVQINGTDLLNGVVGGIGPVAELAARPPGSYVAGYDRKSRTQAQLSTLQVIPRVMGAENMTVIAEVAGQRWSGIGAAGDGRRYGRAFVYGSGPLPIPGLGDICAAGAPALGIAPLNPHASYCENKGYATRHVFGYRLLLELSYSDVFAGVNAKPRLFVSHDVKGWSADGLFSEGRVTVAPGVRFDWRNKYYVDIAYARYARAKYDELHDRDFVSLVAGINF